MPVNHKQSIQQMTKFLSADFRHYETQLAFELGFKLRGFISQNREKAAGGEKALDKNISVSTKATKTGLKVADQVAGVVAVASVQGAMKKATALAQEVHEVKVENEIVQKSKQYKDYFPTDETLLLFSALVMLTIAHRGYVESKEKPGISLANIRDRLLGKNETEMDKMVELEVDKIWSHFDDLVCNKEKYDSFRGKNWAKNIRNLFAVCELGDPKDPVGTHNNYAINELWLNLFAYYLKGEDKDVQRSVMLHLKSVIKVVADMQTISEKSQEMMEKRLMPIKERLVIMEKRQEISEEIEEISEEIERAKNPQLGKEISSEDMNVLYQRRKDLKESRAELKKQLDRLKGKEETAEEGLKSLNGLNGKLEDLVKPAENVAQMTTKPTLYLKYPAAKVKEAPYSPKFFVQNQKAMLSPAELFCSMDSGSYSLYNS